MKIKYNNAKSLIKEADILLFKCGKFPKVGWWISKYTHSEYSHVGIAHWYGGELYCIEFREFIGSRIYKLDEYIKANAKIDVFRVCEAILQPIIVEDDINGGYKLLENMIVFTDSIASKITADALDLVGKKYSYWTIWQMFKTYIPFIRFRVNIKNGEPANSNFVCSSFVAYAYRTNFLDPVPSLSDNYTTPGDLARSALFFKIFEIEGCDIENFQKECNNIVVPH